MGYELAGLGAATRSYTDRFLAAKTARESQLGRSLTPAELEKLSDDVSNGIEADGLSKVTVTRTAPLSTAGWFAAAAESLPGHIADVSGERYNQGINLAKTVAHDAGGIVGSVFNPTLLIVAALGVGAFLFSKRNK